MTDREWALRDGLGWFLRNLGQPCLFVVLGDGGRGVDIPGGCIHWQVRLGTAPGPPGVGSLRMIAGILIHGPKLSAGLRHRQRGTARSAARPMADAMRRATPR